MDKSKTKKGKIDKETTKVLQSPGIHISDMKIWDEENEEYVQVNGLQSEIDVLTIPDFLRRPKK